MFQIHSFLLQLFWAAYKKLEFYCLKTKINNIHFDHGLNGVKCHFSMNPGEVNNQKFSTPIIYSRLIACTFHHLHITITHGILCTFNVFHRTLINDSCILILNWQATLCHMNNSFHIMAVFTVSTNLLSTQFGLFFLGITRNSYGHDSWNEYNVLTLLWTIRN